MQLTGKTVLVTWSSTKFKLARNSVFAGLTVTVIIALAVNMAASQNEHEISYPRFSTTDDLIYALMDLYSDIQQLSYNLHINQAQSARLLARLSLVNQELAACEHDLVRPSSKLEHALYRLLSFLQQVKAFYTRYSDSLWFHTVMHCTNDRLEFLRLVCITTTIMNGLGSVLIDNCHEYT